MMMALEMAVCLYSEDAEQTCFRVAAPMVVYESGVDFDAGVSLWLEVENRSEEPVCFHYDPSLSQPWVVIISAVERGRMTLKEGAPYYHGPAGVTLMPNERRRFDIELSDYYDFVRSDAYVAHSIHQIWPCSEGFRGFSGPYARFIQFSEELSLPEPEE